MTPPPFPVFEKEFFIETAFERRFQGMLRSTWQKRAWHVIVADPGSGKTMGIRDVIRTAGSPSGTLPGRSYPLLAVTAPKNDESEQALGNYLFTALGLPLRGRWSERKCKLMGALVQFGVQCLIVDDAHDLSLEHLIFLKELTDQGRLPPYDHPLGLCLVTAGRGNTIPLKEIFDQPETMWIQFRRRLDRLQPFCRIAGHSSEEVREILAALETVYREPFPHLNLRQWSGAIYTWLTQPVLDPTSSGRVVMDYLMKLVITALEWSYAVGETDVRAETLEAAAELLTLRRDAIRMIDGAGPTVEVRSPEQEQKSVPQAEPEVEPASDPPKRRRKKTTETVGENAEMASPAPSDRNERAPALDPPKRRRKKTPETVGENAEVEGKAPSNLSLEAPGSPKRRRKKTGDSVTENVEERVKIPSSANGEASSAQVDAGSPVLPTKPKRTRRAGEPKPKRNPVSEAETEHTT